MRLAKVGYCSVPAIFTCGQAIPFFCSSSIPKVLSKKVKLQLGCRECCSAAAGPPLISVVSFLISSIFALYCRHLFRTKVLCTYCNLNQLCLSLDNSNPHRLSSKFYT